MSNQEIKVSVCVVTYNQERYIAECLQSLVDQETKFNFEVIVSDDCSTDKTPEIIKNFQERYPGIIKPIFHKRNMGAYKNFIFVHEQAKGKYIAHVDGDDYALPGKLQIQADYLDHNAECNMVFHRMNFIEGGFLRFSKPLSEKVLNYKFYRKDIIEYIAIGAHSSKMYRSSVGKIDKPNFDMVDYTVNVLQVKDGYAAYCGNQALGVYRVGVGIAGSTKVNLSVYNSLKYFFKKYKDQKLYINISAWGWFLNNLKYNKETKWKFFSVVIETFTILGLFRYLKSRKFRRELSGL